MKRFLLSILAFLPALMWGCGAKSTSLDDFAEVLYAPRHASGFEIRAAHGSRSSLLRIFNPWQGASAFEQQVFVARQGESAPEGFTGTVVEAPVRRVVCMSSSHVAMLDAVGCAKRIVGVSGVDYIVNEHVAKHRLCGEIRDVGYDANVNFELIASMKSDVVLIYGVNGENRQLTAKFDEIGVPYIYIGDYIEESPLGKAEWLRVVGELCDCTERADSTFAAVEERYISLKNSISSYLKECDSRPDVLLNTPYRDTWFVPSARSYMVQLIEDAGGKTYTTKTTSTASQPIDIEQAYLLASQADLWLNVGFCTSLSELAQQNPRFAQMPCVVEGRVYNNNARRTAIGGSDFWESGVVNPDKILRDLITIIHPESGVTDGELYYYHQLK